jgi:alpha-tubulin suppressor-like RCC1 family protein
VIWAIESGGAGTLSSTTGNTVFYQAPASSFGRVVRITATSVQDLGQKKTIFISVNPRKASIAAGGGHSLALKPNGTLLSWGNDSAGQLGDGGTNTDQSTPVAVSGASNIVAITAGYYHSLALKADGTLLGWGAGSYGQLGDGTSDDKPVPTPITNPLASNIIAISANGSYSMALKSDGTILAWGYGGNGELGNGDNNATNIPTPIRPSAF